MAPASHSAAQDPRRNRQAWSVLIVSTLAFTVCFMVWMMFGIIGIPIKKMLDLRLPDGSGLDLLRRIGAASIGTAVVMLSGDLDRQTVQEALAAGAVGYVPKTEPREIIAGALGLVLAGGVYVPPVALQTAARTFDTRAATPEALGLTGRQLEVLALLMQGKNNKLICRALGLAEPTVKNHVSAILRALGVDSRTEAVLAVTRLGWALPQPR